MQITEEIVNSAAVKMIDDVIVSPYEYSSLETNDNTLRLVTLGHIRGILDMADCIKEVLKS